MTDSEVLQRVIEIAISKGWDVFETECHQIEVFEATNEMRNNEDDYYYDAPHNGLMVDIRRRGYWGYKEVIYNHEFAKSLWGEARNAGRYLAFPDKDDPKHGSLAEYGWRYHLQMMVVSEDPIDYLRKYINEAV